MPLGEISNCVLLVFLALTLMITFPRHFYCSCSSTSSSLSSSSNIVESQLSQPEQHSATAANPSNLCHNSIDTSQLISSDCQQPLRKQQESRIRNMGDVNGGQVPSCPVSCGETAGPNEKNSSCYHYLVKKDCEKPWLNDWSEIRLQHCCEHSIHEVIPNADVVLSDSQQCGRHVNELLELDVFVAKVTCQFSQVLLRYDCQQKYSVNNCETCKDAYRKWVCASLIPHWRERHKIKPCRSICHKVEQTCPWFLPSDKIPGYPAQYAGEPIFQCIDANIPETGEQLQKSTYGSSCCYEYCEQHRNIEVSISNYHQLDKSKFPFIRTITCERGCNNSTNDPSQDTNAGASSPCQNSGTTSTSTPSPTSSPSNSNKNSALPFVNFPLSSCPTSHDSPQTAASPQHSGTYRNKLSNAITLWIVLYLLIINIRLKQNGLR